MDWAYDESGVKYDVTIISSLPEKADGSLDFCDPYRTIQDGAHSSIIQDLLPQPPSMRDDAPDSGDWTFLENYWKDVEIAYYSGKGGCLVFDPDKGGPLGYTAVLDVNDKPVCNSENGEQMFEVAPYIGAWMGWVYDGSAPWGFRIDRKLWSRP